MPKFKHPVRRKSVEDPLMEQRGGTEKRLKGGGGQQTSFIKRGMLDWLVWSCGWVTKKALLFKKKRKGGKGGGQ